MSYGYTGKILHVNLTTSEIEVEEPGEHLLHEQCFTMS